MAQGVRPRPKRSAGVLVYRHGVAGLEVLLVHPGGPFWSRKDEGGWFIPKGEINPEEEPLAAAYREFEEELGSVPPEAGAIDLGEIVQPSRKVVTAFAFEGDFDPVTLASNVFEMEWPPKSGRKQSFPEADRAEWFSIEEARKKMLPGQVPFIDRLIERLGVAG